MEKKSFFRTKFSEDIFNHKYKHEGAETWENLAHTLVEDVCRDKLTKDEKEQLKVYIRNMKFIPGGRYLYYAGRAFKAFNNCYLLRSEEDSREDWANLSWKAESCLMTGGGIGNNYSIYRPKNSVINKTGGLASGPLSKMKMVNEIGREVMQGGSRRSAIYASLNWKHQDIGEFIHSKDWYSMKVAGTDFSIGDLKEKDFNFAAPLDMTNISVNYDTEWLENYKKTGDVGNIFLDNVKQALKTSEPGFSFNFYENENETLRNACQPEFATVLTPDGIRTFKEIKEGSIIWSGKQWTRVIKKWSTGIKPVYKYNTSTGSFIGTSNHRIVENQSKVEVSEAQSIDWNVGPPIGAVALDIQNIMDGLVLGDGSVHKASNNLVYLYIGQKDQDYFNSEIKELIIKHRPGLSPNAYEINTTITSDELPKTYLRTIPDRFYYGDNRVKCAFLRGLFSANGSINGNRICLKQSSKQLIEQVRDMLSSIGIHSYITTNVSKPTQFSNGVYQCKESYDINITSGRDLFKTCIGFIQSYKNEKIILASKPKYLTSNIQTIEELDEHEVFEITVEADEHTYWTGGLLVSNCTEVTSEDDSDVCNLGSVNLAEVETIEEFKDIVELSTKFLLCGTLVADLPYEKVYKVREKNRRLGLGLMGIHEWLLKKGYQYEVTPELHEWLYVYKNQSNYTSRKFADKLGVSRPVKNRAIAPTGK